MYDELSIHVCVKLNNFNFNNRCYNCYLFATNVTNRSLMDEHAERFI